jgi:L-alanine-DL-glutamate epimerase-like enolase superfamily enzyme
VTALSAAAYTVPTDQPEADGTFAWDSTTLVVVHADGEGERGVGWTYAPAAAVAVVDELLRPVVEGRPVDEVEQTWEAMVRAVRNAGRPGLVGMALSAVDIALWDLLGRAQGRALVDLWTGDPQPVPLYGSGGFTTYDDDTTRRQLEGWCEQGLAWVKIKIGESWGSRTERDLHRVDVARAAVGETTGLFVDANGGYTAEEAVRVGHELERRGVEWFEEPVSSDDHEGLAGVRDRLAVDVAAGEYGDSLAYFRHLAPYVDCLQVDVTRCGGYTEWRRIVDDPARTAAAGWSVHCAPYASLPVASLTPGLRHQEWFHDHVRIEQALFEGWVPPVEGRLAVDRARPGHGMSLRTEVAEKYRVA